MSTSPTIQLYSPSGNTITVKNTPEMLGAAKSKGWLTSPPLQKGASPSQVKPPSAGAGSVLGDLATGFSNKVISSNITPISKLLNKIPGVGQTLAPTSGIKAMESMTKPQNITQKIGGGIQTAAELAAPIGSAAKGTAEAIKGGLEARKAEYVYQEAKGLREAATALENGILKTKGVDALEMYKKGKLGTLLDATTAKGIKEAMGDSETLNALQDMVHQGAVDQKAIAPLVHAALSHPEVAGKLTKWALGSLSGLGIGGMLTYIYHRTIFDMVMRAFESR